jgi:serine/threonine-protein kinase HipA
LFGSPHLPETTKLDPQRMDATARGLVQDVTRPFERHKVDVDLSADGRQLQIAAGSGRFMLMPQSPSFPQLPENESLTMGLAAIAGVEVQPHGMVRLRDGSLALLVRRFDRLDDGTRLRVDRFCELTGKRAGGPPGQLADASAESAADITRRSASEPIVALLKLYRSLVSAWWTGDGDFRLSTLAFVTGPDNVRRFAPASRLACTRLLIPDDPPGLSVGGRTDRLARADWARFGEACGLRPRAVDRALNRIVAAFDDALGLVSRSCLSDPRKIAYAEMLGRRTARLEK